MATTCDPKCYELAQHFLSDHDTGTNQQTEALTKHLACAIQQAVEDWKDDRDAEAEEREAREEEMRALRGATDEQLEKF